MNLLLSRQFKIALSSLLFFGALWTVVIEPGLLTIRRETVTAPEHLWKQEVLRIVLFSDLHAGSFRITESYIEKLVERVNAEEPDLILIAGDFCINGVLGGKTIPFERVAELLGGLKAKYGNYAVLGNHDWWNDGARIRSALEKNSITVLENETRLIPYGERSKIQLIGVGDDYTGHANFLAAFKNVNPELARFVLTHDPSVFLDLKEQFDFGFAGHTHGGQVYLPFIGAPIIPGRSPRTWARGWVTDHKSRTLFITQGIGTSILPVRLNAPPEIVVFDFKP